MLPLIFIYANFVHFFQCYFRTYFLIKLTFRKVFLENHEVKPCHVHSISFYMRIYHGHLSTNRNGVNLFGVYNLRYVAFLLGNGISLLSRRHPRLVRRWVNDACLTSIEIHFTVEGIANKLRAGFPLKFRFAPPFVFETRGVFLWSEKKAVSLRLFGILIYEVCSLGKNAEPTIMMDNEKEWRENEILPVFLDVLYLHSCSRKICDSIKNTSAQKQLEKNVGHRDWKNIFIDGHFHERFFIQSSKDI